MSHVWIRNEPTHSWMMMLECTPDHETSNTTYSPRRCWNVTHTHMWTFSEWEISMTRMHAWSFHTCAWVTSRLVLWLKHIRTLPHKWMSHVTSRMGMRHKRLLFWKWVMSCVWFVHIYEWVMSHIWMSHVTRMLGPHSWMSHVSHMNQSYRTYEWVTWMRHVVQVASPIYEWAMSRIWMSHASHMSESCLMYQWVTWMRHVVQVVSPIYEWAMSRIWMSHASHMSESCLMYEWVMSHIWMSHVSHMNESSLTHEWVMSHVWMSHVNEARCPSGFTWLIGISLYKWPLRYSCTCVKWPSHGSFVYRCTSGLLYTNEPCAITRTNESRHIYERVMSHIWMSHASHMNESCHTHEWVMSHIWMCHVTSYMWMRHAAQEGALAKMSHVTLMNESCLAYEWVTSRI